MHVGCGREFTIDVEETYLGIGEWLLVNMYMDYNGYDGSGMLLGMF